MKKVMLFGIFDGLHKTHDALFKEAKEYGDRIIAVVAQDHIVHMLMGSIPTKNLADRFEHLKNTDGVDEVVIGDAELETWNIVKRHKPEVVAFSHDQETLMDDFKANMEKLGYAPTIVMLKNSETTKGE